MYDCLDAPCFEGLAHHPGVAEVGPDKGGIGVNGTLVTRRKVIEHGDVVTPGDEGLDGDAADIPGTTGNENINAALV